MTWLLWILLICVSLHSFSQPVIPAPDHIVVLIMENHSYNQIIGSKEAPTINTLIISSNTALFTQSYGLAYPSQPNYVSFFSGCNQGIIDDTSPKTIPFTSENLGRQLLDAGKSFISYAEDLPQAGYDGETAGLYVRRHNPAVYWMGNGVNQLPPSVIQPFTSFPENFALLPTVCFVVPNNQNNMHDGSILQGDQWINSHLKSYVEWAKTHNSLFVLTFDEDDKSQDNHVATLLAGEMVRPGNYSQKINHINILRTIEEMYGLPYACDASKADPLTGCWNTPDSTSVNETTQQIKVHVDPVRHKLTVLISKDYLKLDLKFTLMNIYGEIVKEASIQSSQTTLHTNEFSAGVYIYKLSGNNRLLHKGKIVIPS
ncbi:MAG: alkaline phosphatase family protein [Methylococcaceae bacterium]